MVPCNSCLDFLLPFTLGSKKDMCGCATLITFFLFKKFIQSLIYLHCQYQQDDNSIETFTTIILDKREAMN